MAAVPMPCITPVAVSTALPTTSNAAPKTPLMIAPLMASSTEVTPTTMRKLRMGLTTAT